MSTVSLKLLKNNLEKKNILESNCECSVPHWRFISSLQTATCANDEM